MYLHLKISLCYIVLLKTSHWKVCDACQKTGKDGIQSPFQQCKPP